MARKTTGRIAAERFPDSDRMRLRVNTALFAEAILGLELDERLKQRDADPQCGLQIIDLNTGSVVEWVRLDGTLVTELYDAVVLPGVRQPMALGFKTNEVERLLLVDEEGTL